MALGLDNVKCSCKLCVQFNNKVSNLYSGSLMFSMVLFSGVRDEGSIDSQLELEACSVLIQAGRPSTVPVSELESLKPNYSVN